MIHLLNTKDVTLLKPQSVASTATVTARLDVKGWDYAKIDLHLDSAASTTTSPLTLKLSESDDTTTTVTDITAAVGGTAAGNFTMPADKTTDNVITFLVDCRARKRYLKLTYTPGGTQLLEAKAILDRGEISPSTDAGAGDTLRVII